MKRHWFAALGAVFLLADLWLVGSLGAGLLDSRLDVARFACWSLAGVLFVVGGSAPSVADVAWYRFVGLAAVLMGLSMALAVPAELLAESPTSPEALAYVVVAAAGGLALALIGVDWFVGGRNFDLSEFEDGTGLGS